MLKLSRERRGEEGNEARNGRRLVTEQEGAVVMKE
jgi:hypothetical protein